MMIIIIIDNAFFCCYIIKFKLKRVFASSWNLIINEGEWKREKENLIYCLEYRNIYKPFNDLIISNSYKIVFFNRSE